MNLFYSFDPNPRLRRMFMGENDIEMDSEELDRLGVRIAPSLTWKRIQGRYHRCTLRCLEAWWQNHYPAHA